MNRPNTRIERYRLIKREEKKQLDRIDRVH